MLVQVTTWSHGNKMKVLDENVDATLENFKKYVKTAETSQKDAIMLLSCVLLYRILYFCGYCYCACYLTLHRTFDYSSNDGNHGISYEGSMCNPLAILVVKDRDILYKTSSTTAHELGHTFGLKHDNEISEYCLKHCPHPCLTMAPNTTENCYCPDSQGCIMTAYSYEVVIKTLWSDCSYNKFNTILNDLTNISCLTTDIPKTIVAHAICGNGIREGSESCDCGSSKVSSGPV